MFACLAGCNRFETGYGNSSGFSGRNSINGFYGLRKAFESDQHETHDVQRLSDRTARHDVIVWIPKTLGPIDTKPTRWLETWLEEGDRTLVYLIPDSGNEVNYWQSTTSMAPVDQRLEYRRRAAEAINQRIEWRLNRNDLVSNGWFQVRSLDQQVSSDRWSGPWSNSLERTAAPNEAPSDWGVEFLIGDYDSDINDGAIGNSGVGWAATGPSSQPAWIDEPKVLVSDTQTTFTPLLTDDAGNPVIAEITSDDWPGSRVLVVAGGSLLTNYSLVEPERRRIVRQLVHRSTLKSGPESVVRGSDQTPGSRHVAFLETDSWRVNVSEATSGPPRTSGMELLSVWPLSLITVHAAIFGLLACLVMLPIFGRPRRVPRDSGADFGNHLDAVAALMLKTSADDYARQKLNEYVRTVRGDGSARH